MSELLKVIYGGYGAYELKSKYQRGLLFGTLTAVSMVLMILAAAYIRSELGLETVRIDVDKPILIESVVKLPLQKSFRTEKQKRVGVRGKTPPVVGTMPVMVADDEFIDEDFKLATQDERAILADPGYPVGDGERGSGIAVDIPPESDSIPPMNEFRKLEVEPVMIYAAKTEYPRLARIAGLEGTVWIKALVDRNGNVIRAVVYKSSGVNAGFDEAALAAAYKCKFQPGIQNGYPVNTWVTYGVRFVLKDAD